MKKKRKYKNQLNVGFFLDLKSSFVAGCKKVNYKCILTHSDLPFSSLTDTKKNLHFTLLLFLYNTKIKIKKVIFDPK